MLVLLAYPGRSTIGKSSIVDGQNKSEQLWLKLELVDEVKAMVAVDNGHNRMTEDAMNLKKKKAQTVKNSYLAPLYCQCLCYEIGFLELAVVVKRASII